MKKLLIPAVILASTLSLTATAADSGFFIGAAIGQSDLDDSFFDDSTTYKIVTGYDFNRNWGFGIEYIDMGGFDPDVSNVSGDVEIDGFNFFGSFTYPVTETFSVFAKAGAFSWDVNSSLSGPDITSENSDGTNFSWGLGAALNATNNAAVTLEFQRFSDIDGGDIDTITAGITYHF